MYFFQLVKKKKKQHIDISIKTCFLSLQINANFVKLKKMFKQTKKNTVCKKRNFLPRLSYVIIKDIMQQLYHCNKRFGENCEQKHRDNFAFKPAALEVNVRYMLYYSSLLLLH